MNDYHVDRKNLLSESDVEQKVIFPLLTNKEPLGLGFDNTEIQTKVNLQKLTIDKGAKSILYYPDYLITIDGVPLMVVEAKKPDEDLEEAFRQASLYAAELNRKFAKDVNPCKLIIACDGIQLFAGAWDAAKPMYKITTDNWLITNKPFNEFSNVFSKSATEKSAAHTKNLIRRNVVYKRPLNLLGGAYIQNKASQNTFGETISIQYKHLFNPNIEEERIDVVQNAYVQVKKHESHVTPIDRLIRKKVNSLSENATDIEDNTNPKEFNKKINFCK